MTQPPARVPAIRAELTVPVASFRDPAFPGVTRCLPVPPPATIRGMLAAATGNAVEPVTLGVSAHSHGGGVDLETYHPVSTDGSNPAVAGRVRTVKGGMTIHNRPFLAMLDVTIWVPLPDSARIAAGLRRPVWGLRLGRSQDLAYLRSVAEVELIPADDALVGYALAPIGGHGHPAAVTLRLSEFVTADRLGGQSGDYLWCAEGAGWQPVTGAYRDGEQAVWLHAIQL
ncbi:MAG: CRISPR-associated protein Cas5 [Trebonia sp.]